MHAVLGHAGALLIGARSFADEILGTQVHHLPHAEAPHRGYDAARALFAGVREGDDVWRAVQRSLKALVSDLRPGLLFAPQGIGGHVDHRETKADAAAAYTSQLGFQFGGEEPMRDAPSAFAQEEARRAGSLRLAESLACAPEDASAAYAAFEAAALCTVHVEHHA